jgi:hypothetical protein
MIFFNFKSLKLNLFVMTEEKRTHDIEAINEAQAILKVLYERLGDYLGIGWEKFRYEWENLNPKKSLIFQNKPWKARIKPKQFDGVYLKFGYNPTTKTGYINRHERDEGIYRDGDRPGEVGDELNTTYTFTVKKLSKNNFRVLEDSSSYFRSWDTRPIDPNVRTSHSLISA